MSKSKRWTLGDIERIVGNSQQSYKKTEEAVQKLTSLVKKSGKTYRKLPTASASDLTKDVLQFLDLRGYQVWRQNNNGVYDPTKKVFRANSVTKGISDIIGYHRKTGRFIACEIKAGKDQLSDEQELFLEGVARSGGISLVIRTTDDIENLSKRTDI